MTSTFMLAIFLVNTVEAMENEKSTCLPDNLPSWIDWMTPEARSAKPRERLTIDWVKTSMVVILAILVVLANALLSYLLFSDENMWGQRTYKMIFSLACNDCLSGVLLGVAVLTEMESVQTSVKEYTGSHILCKIVIAGLWLCVVTSIYTFNVISVISAG